MSAGLDPPIPVDAHVHLHPCFPLAEFLDGAAAHFAAAAAVLGRQGPPAGVLLLAEGAGEGAAERLARAAQGGAIGGWRLAPLAEPGSLAATRKDGARLLLVGGRQAATAEGLEVLALASSAPLADGAPLAETLAAVRAAGGIAVVPWGAGKWWLGRGRLVAALVESGRSDELFLGDNAGRPRLAPRPALFARAARRGIRVLAGSDPLPFRRHARRAGSRGFVLEAPLGGERPGADLKAALARSGDPPRPYGRGEGLFAFLVNAVAMQLRKRGIGTGGRAA